MKKNRSVRALIFTSVVSAFSSVAFAIGESQATQLDNSFKNIGTIIKSLTTNVVSALSTLFATAAMVVFFYGIVQYIWGVRDGKPDKVTTGNKFMIWGLVALFVMFSVWGIILFAQNIFGIQDKNTIVIPRVQIDGGTTNAGANTNNGSPAGLSGSGSQTPAAGECSGKSNGTPCSPVGSIPRYCQTNTETGSFGCYAGTPCPVGQYPGANGCQSPTGGVN